MRGMRVLGIDPGSEITGWGVVEGDGPRYHALEYGAIRLATGQRFSSRLVTVCDEIEAIIARHNPDVCAIEDGFLATNVKVTLKLGQVRGVAMLAAERAGLEILEYSPRLVKQTVVGYGNAEKHQVQEMVRILLSLNILPEPQDAADALAVAICHFHHAGVTQRILAADARAKVSSLARRRLTR
jgi:crossover junction endodeoxyribonuclease RuvC